MLIYVRRVQDCPFQNPDLHICHLGNGPVSCPDISPDGEEVDGFPNKCPVRYDAVLVKKAEKENSVELSLCTIVQLLTMAERNIREAEKLLDNCGPNLRISQAAVCRNKFMAAKELVVATADQMLALSEDDRAAWTSLDKYLTEHESLLKLDRWES